MGIEYTNRKRQTYYLHDGKTRSGKPRCFFSLKTPGKPVTKIPRGFEIYENPDGLVFLRRIEAQVITDAELATVRSLLAKLAATQSSTTDRKGKYIMIYAAEDLLDPQLGSQKSVDAPAGESTRDSNQHHLQYTPMFRLTLDDATRREFLIERWCFRRSVNGWYRLGGGKLQPLLRTYLPHLGDDSFFEMM